MDEMTSSVGRVFVGVDGSPGSLQALRHALGFARVFAAPLIPVLAWQPPGGESPARAREVPELEQEWVRVADRRLTAAFEEGLGLLPPDVLCEPRLIRGPTGPALVACADRPNDLLVVGTGRHGLFARLAHSRIAGYCISHAYCCVVAVPPPPLADVPRHVRHLTV
jgi:nucleotide-binding universal stress UspA family protein